MIKKICETPVSIAFKSDELLSFFRFFPFSCDDFRIVTENMRSLNTFDAHLECKIR